MGWVKRIEPEHVCVLPYKELHQYPNDGKADEGSVWVCTECQVIWVVVPGHPDSYGSLSFEQITPRLRKRYKL